MRCRTMGSRLLRCAKEVLLRTVAAANWLYKPLLPSASWHQCTRDTYLLQMDKSDSLLLLMNSDINTSTGVKEQLEERCKLIPRMLANPYQVLLRVCFSSACLPAVRRVHTASCSCQLQCQPLPAASPA